MAEELKRKRQRARGKVKSDKMDKTITVTIERLVRHPLYGKYVRRNKAYMAHDPHNDAREGDLVEIESTRPLSRHKRWRLVRVLRRASLGLSDPQAEAQADDVPNVEATA